MKASLSVFLALGLLLAVFAPVGAQTGTPPAATGTPQNCATMYTVRPGDNLYRIGVAHGVPWPTIAAANNLANPNLIFAGQVLCIPAAGTPAATAVVTGTAAATATTAPTAAATATRVVTATAVATGTAPAATPGPAPTQFVIPTFSIVSVVRNTSVTIRTANFPANQTFTVLMGPMGTQGVNGIPSGTTNSGAGGTFTATYTIPVQLANASQIAIRLQSPAGYYSYNWFWNTTAP